MRKAFLLVPDLFSGDGVGNDLLGMDAALEGLAFETYYVCNRIDPELRAKNPSKVLGPDAFLRSLSDGTVLAQDVLIYHYAVEWELGDRIYEGFSGRRILRYHNVTPPELLRPYNAVIADFCARGRERLAQLSEPHLMLADSAENLRDYTQLTGRFADSGERERGVAVLAPFSQTEELLASPADKRWQIRLQNISALKLLYVGRISPHKNVEGLILDLDRSFSGQAVALPKTRVDRFLQYIRRSVRQNASPVLFVVGSFSPAFRSYNRIVRRQARNASALSVEFCEEVSTGELAALYQNCDLFVTASRHEGFCVPVAEALAFQLPMVLPDRAVFHEVSFERAQFFSDLAAESIKRVEKPATCTVFMQNYSNARLVRQLRDFIERMEMGQPR